MTKVSIAGVKHGYSSENICGFSLRLPMVKLAALWLVALATVTGCQTQGPQLKDVSEQSADRNQASTLREGDVLKIYFPGAPNLNTTQRIRMDGKIDLPLVGELKVAGMAPAELREELLRRYADQLVSKEITVTVESSSFPVFVTGAVIRPGKIQSDRPITALEAIMEAGGFDYVKANLKAVVVVRHEGGKVKNYTLNLKLPLQGKTSEPFYLKTSDIVYVPERFSFF